MEVVNFCLVVKLPRIEFLVNCIPILRQLLRNFHGGAVMVQLVLWLQYCSNAACKGAVPEQEA